MKLNYQFPFYTENSRAQFLVQSVIFVVAFLLGWLAVSLVSGQDVDPSRSTLHTAEEIIDQTFRQFEEDPRYRFESRPARTQSDDTRGTSLPDAPRDLPPIRGVAPVVTSEPDAPPVRKIETRIFRCYDRKGIRELDGAPMEVFQIRLPKNWLATGDVKWRTRNIPADRVRVTDLRQPAELRAQFDSPDGQVAIEFYPEVWFSDDRTGRRTGEGQAVRRPVMSAEDYIVDHVVPRQRGVRGARVVRSRSLPALAQIYNERIETLDQTARRSIPEGEGDLNGKFGLRAETIDHDAAVVTVEYHQGATPIRETFVAVIRRVPMADRTLWWADTALSVRGPRDIFDRTAPQVAPILRSFHMNPRWLVRYARIVVPSLQQIESVDYLARQVAESLDKESEAIGTVLVDSIYPSY